MTLEEMNAKYGRPAGSTSSVSLAELWKAPEQRSAIEKVAGFTGGEKIGQGLGQGIANFGISKDIEQNQAQQFEIQGNLLKKIKEKKAAGGDTTKLEAALKLLDEDIAHTGEGAGQLLNQKNITTKEVIGDALQLGTTVLGAGELPGVAKSAAAGEGIVKGAIQGAKSGAIAGGIYGASSGVSDALKDNKSLTDVAKSGLIGGLEGGAAGGVLGGVVGGVSGGLKARALKKETKFLENVTPKTNELTPTEYEDLLRKGKITPKTATEPAKYILSDKEIETATKYKSLIGNKDPVKNSINIIDEISKKDKEVGNFLKKNNGAFNDGELKNYLSEKMKDITDITIDPTRLDTSKQTMIDNFVGNLKKNNMETLWTSRKAFDSTIDKAFSGSPTLQKEVKRALRNGVQDFIADRTPEGVYKTAMRDMHELFNLQEVVSTKASKEKTLSAIGKLMKDNPKSVKTIKWIAGLGVGGYAADKIFN